MTAVGGKRYSPYSSILSFEEWTTHFGTDVRKRFAAAKRKYDPNTVLSPVAGDICLTRNATAPRGRHVSGAIVSRKEFIHAGNEGDVMLSVDLFRGKWVSDGNPVIRRYSPRHMTTSRELRTLNVKDYRDVPGLDLFNPE